MTVADRNMRGQPIIFLGIVACVWILARIIAYLPGQDAVMQNPYAPHVALPGTAMAETDTTENTVRTAAAPYAVRGYPRDAGTAVNHDRGYISQRYISQRYISQRYISQRYISMPKPPALIRSRGMDPAIMAQHHLLYMRSSGYMGGPGFRSAFAAGTQDMRPDKWRHLEIGLRQGPFTSAPAISTSQPDRWSLQGWAFVRPGGRTLSVGQGQYGGSQAGLVGRYALNSQSKRRVHLYARLASALPNGDRPGFDDADIALGVTVRPLPDIPVALAGEQRFALGKSARTRAAAYAVTQIPPVKLPARFSADIYAQAGAAGAKDPQLFFDLQMVAERKIARQGKVDISMGAGLWSGGQTGEKTAKSARDNIVRLDIGPRASVRFPVASGRAKMSLDWRRRVAGNAQPGSGLALTLATDF